MEVGALGLIALLAVAPLALADELQVTLDDSVNASVFPAISADGRRVAAVPINREPMAAPVTLVVFDSRSGAEQQRIEIPTQPADRASGATQRRLEQARALLTAGRYASLALVPGETKARGWRVGDVRFDDQQPSKVHPGHRFRVTRAGRLIGIQNFAKEQIGSGCAPEGSPTNEHGNVLIDSHVEKVWFSARESVAVVMYLASGNPAKDGCEGVERYAVTALNR